MVFGVEDATHQLTGTNFCPHQTKIGNQELENWLATQLNPRIDFNIYEFDYEDKHFVIFRISATRNTPVSFRGEYYIRIGSYKKRLNDHPERERKIWLVEKQNVFENEVAKENVSEDEVLRLLNYEKMFELLDKNVPSSADTILNKLKEYHFCRFEAGKWKITNLGAILFAYNFNHFPKLSGKSVIVRKFIGTNNRNMEFEHAVRNGYAAGFEALVDFIMLHTQKGEKRDVIRTNEYIYPKIAVREFVANALIHQDFTITGMPIAIEIFSDRLSITNPGASLNDINRLIDLPPYSRNEILANTMLLLRFCEKRGSGIDYAIEAVEKQGLPPVKFSKGEHHTRVVMFPSKPLSEMTKEEKVMACYQHACLTYEDNKTINNQSVRERFGIERRNSSIASRILADTFNAGFLKQSEPKNESKRYASYVPFYG